MGIRIILLASIFVLSVTIPSFAAQLRVFVAGIDTVGVPDSKEMKVTLQTLLASRLNGPDITAVATAAEADALISGTCTTIGTVFSIDVLAKTVDGTLLTRAFVQGDTMNELIPSVGKLAEKLSSELVKSSSKLQLHNISPRGMTAARPDGADPAAVVVADKANIERAADEFIKSGSEKRKTDASWQSRRLTGAANLMAVGRVLPDGNRQLFLAEGQRLSYYLQGSDMKLVSETEFSPSGKIVSVDTVSGSDGILDIYVTIIRAGEPSSQVWRLKADKLVLVVKDLPYFFRSANLGGGQTKLYAQSMGRDVDFYGDVAEASRAGSVISLKNPIKMPRYGMIYNFNQFRDGDGKINTVVINNDGYLIVFDPQQKELWRSSDKFGGSELYFQTENGVDARVSLEPYRRVFMNQRIQVLPDNEILIGKNVGTWVVGNARSYQKGAVYSLVWNGSSLDEKWRTRETTNYMPDYYFDTDHNELIMLQMVQRPGFTDRGASSLSVKKLGNPNP